MSLPVEVDFREEFSDLAVAKAELEAGLISLLAKARTLGLEVQVVNWFCGYLRQQGLELPCGQQPASLDGEVELTDPAAAVQKFAFDGEGDELADGHPAKPGERNCWQDPEPGLDMGPERWRASQ